MFPERGFTEIPIFLNFAPKAACMFASKVEFTDIIKDINVHNEMKINFSRLSDTSLHDPQV